MSLEIQIVYILYVRRSRWEPLVKEFFSISGLLKISWQGQT